MTSLTSTLSSRGWAFLVLAGGLALSIPFFKGVTSTKPQYSSTRSDSNWLELNVPVGTPVVASGQSVSSLSPSSSSHVIDKPTTVSAHSPSRTTIDVAGIAELKTPIEQPQSKPNSVTSWDANAEVVVPPKPPVDFGFSGAAPIHTEFPAWAKKPSLLDRLVTSKSTANRTIEETEQTLPTAKKPTPFQAWTPQDTTKSAATNAVSASDRSSPFGDLDDSPEPTHSGSPIRWPDEDPRAAIAQPIVERMEGRDAMIRNPLAQSLPEQFGRTVVHPSAVSTIIPPSLSQNNMVVQPKFGQSLDNSNRGIKVQVGTALRSQIPPDEQQYIRQP